jgi:hypothetical protein
MENNDNGQVAPKPKTVGSTLFWRLFALVNLVAVAWVGWLIWQLTPRPVVNEFVMRMPASQRTSLGAISPNAGPNAATAPTGQEPVNLSVPAAAGQASPPPAAEIAIQSGEPMKPLKLDTEIRLPPKPASATPPAAAPAPPGK